MTAEQPTNIWVEPLAYSFNEFFLSLTTKILFCDKHFELNKYSVFTINSTNYVQHIVTRNASEDAIILKLTMTVDKTFTLMAALVNVMHDTFKGTSVKW